jgi:diguanylate cyclase (GGDEF)-like protein
LVLQEVGNQFRRVIGDDVEVGDFSARLGGDEFVVALFDKSTGEVLETAEAINEALAAPITVADITVRIASSIGISYWPDDGSELGVLLRKADLAMYMAKNRGGNCWAEFEHQAEAQISLDMVIGTGMQAAEEDRTDCHFPNTGEDRSDCRSPIAMQDGTRTVNKGAPGTGGVG